MPHSVNWYIPKRVIYVYVEGDVDLDKAKQVNQSVLDLLEQGDHPIYVISSSANINVHGANAKDLVTSQTYLDNPAIGKVFILAESRFIQFLGVIANTIFQKKILVVANYDHAIEYLKANVQGLDWSQAQFDLLEIHQQS